MVSLIDLVGLTGLFGLCGLIDRGRRKHPPPVQPDLCEVIRASLAAHELMMFELFRQIPRERRSDVIIKMLTSATEAHRSASGSQAPFDELIHQQMSDFLQSLQELTDLENRIGPPSDGTARA